MATITCPFAFCRSSVELVILRASVKDENAQMQQIPLHVVKHPKIQSSQNCPASLMSWPLTPRQLERLAGQLMTFLNLMPREDGNNVAQEMVDFILYGADGPERGSTPLGGGNRTGRQPDANDPAWQRGGRADEDVPEGPPLEGLQERKPLGANVPMTEGASSVASNSEILIAIQDAQLKGRETQSVIGEATRQAEDSLHAAQELMAEARRRLLAINQGAESERVNSMIASFSSAVDSAGVAFGAYTSEMDKAMQAIEAAIEKGHEHAQAILG